MQSLKNFNSVDELLSYFLPRIGTIPDCAERYLLELMCLLEAKSREVNTLGWLEGATINLDNALFQEVIKKLKDALVSEEIFCREFDELLASCQRNIVNQQWHEAGILSQKLYKENVIFDMYDTLDLIKKTDETAALIQEQDIILLMGVTGSGKSTTIQYLAGETMLEKAVSVGQLRTGDNVTKKHIEAVDIRNPAIHAIRSSYRAESETRYIGAVPVKKADIRSLKTDIILCDTPGFDDTRGPELDVANGIGFVRAVKTCKTVRPVILVDAKGIGSRCEGLRRMLEILSGIVPKLRSYIDDAFTFAFTKFGESEAEQILATLMTLKESLSEDEKREQSFVQLLDAMMAQVEEEEHLVVMPLDKKPGNAYKKIFGREPIKKPAEAFRCFITRSSSDKLREQIRRYQLAIANDLKLGNYSIIGYRLQQMGQLNTQLQDPFIGQLIDECEQQVQRFLSDYYSQNLRLLERVMADEYPMKEEDILTLLTVSQRLQTATRLPEHLIRDHHYALQFDQQWSIHGDQMYQRLLENKLGFNDAYLLERLNKFSLLWKCHKEKLGLHYQKAQVLMQEVYSKLIIDTKTALKEGEYDSAYQLWQQLQLGSQNLKGHLKDQDLSEGYTSVKAYFQQQLKANYARVMAIFEQLDLHTDDLIMITDTLSMFAAVRAKDGLKSHVDLSQVAEMEKAIFDQAVAYLDGLHRKIGQQFELDDPQILRKVEPNFRQVQAIRNIAGMPRAVEDAYRKIERLILNRARNLGGSFDSMLQALIEGRDVDYRLLARGVQGLQEAAWVDEIDTGTYQSVLASITEVIQGRLEQIQGQIEMFDLAPEQTETMADVTKMIAGLEAMKPLDKVIASLATIRLSIMEKLEQLIQPTLNMIKREFSLEGLGLRDLEQSIAKLKLFQSHYHANHPALLYLKKHRIENLEELKQKISDSNTEIEKHKETANDQLGKLNAEKRAYVDISLEYNRLEQERLQSQSSVSSSFSFTGFFESTQPSVNKAQEYLRLKKYHNIDEVVQKISEKETEINKFKQKAQKHHKGLTDHVKELENIQLQYNRLLETDQVSDEAKAVLREIDYTTIELLVKGIEEKEEQLRLAFTQNIAYQFTKMDMAKAHKSIHYLEWCKQQLFPAKMRGEINETFDAFVTYIKRYKEFLESRIQYYFNRIKDHCEDQKTESNISDDSQALLNRLQELRDIRDHFSQLMAYFMPNELLNTANRTLDEIALDLQLKMQQATVSSTDTSDLSRLLSITRALNPLDDFSKFEGAGLSFTALYRQFQPAVFRGAGENETKARECIDNHDYKGLSHILLALERSQNQASATAIERIKQYLSNALRDYTERMKIKVILLNDQVQESWLTSMSEIKTDLDRTSDAIRSVGNCLGIINESYELPNNTVQFGEAQRENSYTLAIAEVKQMISERVIRTMENITGAIENCHFFEANQSMSVVQRVKEILGGYLSSDAIERVSRFTDDLQRALADQERRYESMDLSSYTYYPPKDNYKRFSQVMQQNQKCRQAWENIETIIRKKFRDELQNIKTAGGQPDTRTASVRRFELAVKSLPEHLQHELTGELDDIKLSIENEQKDKKLQFEEALANHNTDRLHELLQITIDREGRHGNTVKECQREVLERIQDLRRLMNDFLTQGNVETALQYIEQLYRYKIFEQHQPQIRDVIQLAIHQVKSIYNKACKGCEEISANTSAEEMCGNYDLLLKFYVFHEKSKNTQEASFLSELLEVDPKVKLDAVKGKIDKFYEENMRQYQSAISGMEVITLKQVMDTMLRLELFFKPYRSTESHLPGLSYEEAHAQLQQSVNSLLTSFQGLDLINEQTRGFEKGRHEFYNKLVQNYTIVKQLPKLGNHLQQSEADLVQIECQLVELLKAKVLDLVRRTLELINRNRLSEADYKEFNCYFDNLSAVKIHFPTTPALIMEVDEALKTVNEKISCMLDEIHAKLLSNPEIQVFVEGLVKLKSIGTAFPHRTEQVNRQIDDCLDDFKKSHGVRAQEAITRLAGLLREEESGLGATIVAEHAALKSAALSQANEVRRKTHHIEYVLTRLRSPENNADLDIAQLRRCYGDFESKYNELKRYYLKPDLEKGIKAILSEIKYIIAKFRSRHKENQIVWTASMRDDVPILMAHIFMLWTLKNATNYFDFTSNMSSENDKNNYLYIPHPAQVVSIFRILGIGYKENSLSGSHSPSRSGSSSSSFMLEGLKTLGRKVWSGSSASPSWEISLSNNLIQINTGEGKSVTLAVTAAILALYEIDVNCACYSDYLSRRDYDDFRSIFEDLGIIDRIHYGTFDKLCEDIVNRDGNVRDIVTTLVQEDKFPQLASRAAPRPNVLLVDEVDVFFNKDFYGNLYSLAARLRSHAILELVNCIWQHRDSIEQLEDVQQLAQYDACCSQYRAWSILIDEAIKDMIAALKSYKSHQYLVIDDKIAYKEQDSISFTVTYGYKTLFAYYHEHYVTGKISEQSLQDYVSINLRCGSFSYAQLPDRFVNIMGVTGTLEYLSHAECEVMREQYGIERHTYMPSVYGDNKRRFAPDGDISIEDEDNYYSTIRDQIIDRMKGRTEGTRRAVLVFFENKEKLQAFANSEHITAIPYTIEIMTEEANESEKKRLVKEASRSGHVTLLTRCFGRGTDFISYSPQVEANGGVHVIQTFLSEEKSEEIQIMGRTARQGQEGSYSLVLSEKDLETFLIRKEDIDRMRAEGVYHSRLDEKRNAYFSAQYLENSKFIVLAWAEHRRAEEFVEALYRGDREGVKAFLIDKNKGAVLQARSSRTVCLMDATGSMSHLLQKAKNTVGTMFERANTVLKGKFPGGAFEMQFVVFRNYNSPIEEIIQCSGWETKAENLYEFMGRITAKGGCGDSVNEAIEIGLWHCNEEAKSKKGISQVILIGDAPPNTDSEISKRRSKFYGENYWTTSKFGQQTNVTNELAKLKAKKIPVHSFFVVNYTELRSSFESMAASTVDRRGKPACASFLDINSEAGATMLTDMVTKEILRGTAKTAEQAEELVQEYDKLFTKSHIR